MTPGVTKVAIVYGAKSGHVRRHIYATASDDEYDSHHRLLPGEAMCFVDIAAHHAGFEVFSQAIRDAVQAHGNVKAVLHGNDPGAVFFVHIDLNGVVDNLAMVDPDIDAAVLTKENWQSFDLAQGVGVGWQFKNGTFVDLDAGKLRPKASLK